MFKTLVVCLLLSGAANAASAADDISTKLGTYGQTVAASAQRGVLKYVKVKQTMGAPMVAYLLTFTTSDPSLKANPKGGSDKTAYMENTAKRLVWEAKFCTPQLKSLMRAAHVDIVTGELVDATQTLQFSSMCMKS